MNFILFIIGASLGSFINVLSLRYKSDKPIFNKTILFGRSHCLNCGNTLNWRELIPIISFILQRGKCRKCKTGISLQYPIVEIISGLVFVFIPLKIYEIYQVGFKALGGPNPIWFYLIAALFLLFALSLILLSSIDFRLRIIPDQINLFIAAIGILLILVSIGYNLSEYAQNSFIGFYSFLFGFQENIWINRLIGLISGTVFLGAITVLSRGRGMGLGDVKLAGAAGLLLGWPDAILGLLLAFIIGAIWSIILLLRGSRTLKSAVPFGPFIALGYLIIIFFGKNLMAGYFMLFP